MVTRRFQGPIGVCDRCGKWRELSDLKKQITAGALTGLKVCYDTCYDEDHPQQFRNRALSKTERVSVDEPRPADQEGQWLIGNPPPPMWGIATVRKAWGTTE